MNRIVVKCVKLGVFYVHEIFRGTCSFAKSTSDYTTMEGIKGEASGEDKGLSFDCAFENVFWGIHK